MNRFIEITGKNGRAYLINLDQLVRVEQLENGDARLIFNGDISSVDTHVDFDAITNTIKNRDR